MKEKNDLLKVNYFENVELNLQTWGIYKMKCLFIILSWANWRDESRGNSNYKWQFLVLFWLPLILINICLKYLLIFKPWNKLGGKCIIKTISVFLLRQSRLFAFQSFKILSFKKSQKRSCDTFLAPECHVLFECPLMTLHLLLLFSRLIVFWRWDNKMLLMLLLLLLLLLLL